MALIIHNMMNVKVWVHVWMFLMLCMDVAMGVCYSSGRMAELMFMKFVDYSLEANRILFIPGKCTIPMRFVPAGKIESY